MLRRTVPESAVAAFAALAIACGGPPSGPGPVGDGPVVYSVTPNTGSTAGGTVVTIRGARFAADAAVAIGGQLATDVNVQNSEVISATTPPGAGVADVVVTVAGRSGRLRAGFTYQIPPNNALPVIMSISAQGTRSQQPADFADLGETIAVSANVRDDETAADQLEYTWSASAGTFSGTGSSVSWQAPVSADTPVDVTITLRVVERYGSGGIFRHEVSATRRVSLHDSVRELGDMALRFLTEFSKPQTNQDWRDIMRDFNAAICPHPNEVEDERTQVIDHYTNVVMHNYNVGSATVQVNFGGACFAGLTGDACVSVPVFWDSTDKTTNTRGSTSGTDHLTGAYGTVDARWWLCSSRYQATTTVGYTFYTARSTSR